MLCVNLQPSAQPPTPRVLPSRGRWHPPSSTTHNILSLGHANGLFLAGTLSGEILISPNGIDWSFAPVLNCDRLFGMAYGKITYVRVGDRAVLTSDDTVSWTVQNTGTTNFLTKVIFASSRFVAVGLRQAVVLSSCYF